jgi:hypothetical protein
MACALTQDISYDCQDGLGGIDEMYAMEFPNMDSVTVAAGVVTAITKATGKKFWKYQLPRETADAKSTVNSNEQNGSLFFLHEVKLIINKLTSAVRNELLLLAKNRLVIVVKDNNGKYWMLGRQKGLVASGGQITLGVAYADRNGVELDFSGAEPEPMVEVDETTAGTLQTPGA